MLGVLVVFSSAQIVLRNLFSIGVTWGDGLTRLVVLWLALLGALAASREGSHITMGAVTRGCRQSLQIVSGRYLGSVRRHRQRAARPLAFVRGGFARLR